MIRTRQEPGRLWAPLCVSAALVAAPAGAQTIELSLPVACTLPDQCYIRQFRDNDPTEGAVRDFACGTTMAKDGHSGVDFAVPDLAAMRTGVAVLAAAPGTVIALRDGLPDIDMRAEGAPDLNGQDCGNGMRIAHADGWETQYCHLRRGSINVKDGDKVEAGTRIGLIGMSGAATFPHVHFMVRKGGKQVDPFDPGSPETCGVAQEASTLWTTPPAYRDGGLLRIGLADRVPAFEAIKEGLPTLPQVPQTTPALVVWGYAYNAQPGDVMELALSGPVGEIGVHQAVIEKTHSFAMRAWGKRTPPQGWPKGEYVGQVRHLRAGRVLSDRQISQIVE